MVTGVTDEAGRFYERALTEAERADLSEALKVEGLEQEVALLRLRLRRALAPEDEDFALFLRGLDVLRRMVVARYGLSKGDAKGLETAMDGLLGAVGIRGGDRVDDRT